jgi:hypothetical protein
MRKLYISSIIFVYNSCPKLALSERYLGRAEQSKGRIVQPIVDDED